MKSMVKMLFRKSKIGKKSYFWTGQTRSWTPGQTGQNTEFVRVHEIKIINLKGVLGQDKVGVKHRVCPRTDNL